MSVFHFFKIVKIVPNRAKYHIYKETMKKVLTSFDLIKAAKLKGQQQQNNVTKAKTK